MTSRGWQAGRSVNTLEKVSPEHWVAGAYLGVSVAVGLTLYNNAMVAMVVKTIDTMIMTAAISRGILSADQQFQTGRSR